MAIPGYLKAAAKKGAAATAKRKAAAAAAKATRVAKTAKATAGGSGTIELLKAGKYGAALKTPGGMIGALFLLQMIMSRIMEHYKTSRGIRMQEGAIEEQMGRSPEDIYYQAALPSLIQERQEAQNALLQAILSGSGQTIQVPGERRIGGGI